MDKNLLKSIVNQRRYFKDQNQRGIACARPEFVAVAMVVSITDKNTV